jgi:hypothetical protein
MSDDTYKVKVQNSSEIGLLWYITVMVFLCDGNPDVWDKLQEFLLRL